MSTFPDERIATCFVQWNGTVPQSFVYRLMEQEPLRSRGGSVRIVDSTNFPISTTTAAALVEVEPGGLRELHWHPNVDGINRSCFGAGPSPSEPDGHGYAAQAEATRGHLRRAGKGWFSSFLEELSLLLG